MTTSRETSLTQYDYIFDKMAGESWFIFMNHGFSPASVDDYPSLKTQDDNWRHQTFLYFYLLRTALGILQANSSSGYDLLDIGCGRGGGLSAIKRYYGLRRAIGLDLNARQIAFCKEQHKNLDLEFIQGDALDLPFADDSFDLVLNVESSHLYADIPQFLSEVHRVIKRGGLLLLADLRERQFGISSLEKGILASKLTTVTKCDITQEVHRACALDEQRFAHLFPSERREFPRHIAAAAKVAYSKDGPTAYVVYALGKN